MVRQCMERGLVSGRLAATDSTHVKANASRESEYLAEVPEEPGVYWERLDSFEEEGLEELAGGGRGVPSKLSVTSAGHTSV